MNSHYDDVTSLYIIIYTPNSHSYYDTFEVHPYIL